MGGIELADGFLPGLQGGRGLDLQAGDVGRVGVPRVGEELLFDAFDAR